MDNQRLLIWAFFGMMLWLTWQAWQLDYAPRPAPASIEPLAAGGDEVPPADADPDGIADLPELGGAEDALPAVTPQPTDTAEAPADADAATVSVQTDVLDIEISLAGGTLVNGTLSQYPVHKDQPNIPVTLLSRGTGTLGLIRTGLRSSIDGRAAPGHTATFTAPRREYELGDGEDIVVPLSWRDASGLTVVKRFRFHRGSYRIDVEQQITNGSADPWRGDQYSQILRRSFDHERSMFNVDSYSFDGPIVFNGDKAEKLKRDDLLEDGKFSFTAVGGWVAAIEHHFLVATVPERDATHAYQVSVNGNVMTASVVGAPKSVAPGETATFSRTLFVGPKLQRQLEEIDPKLKLTVDYGWLTILSQPLFWLLSMVYSFVHNWGLAIIAVTILIKLAFYKLTESSGRSMAKMRNLQPRLKQIQERYKDDRQKQSQAMMELYKREKVNPAAGCLPILIQMPFFLAFYWVLLESVEMRQAPFALWITDLSSRDPYFILPLIMGAAMFFQQRLNPQIGDPVQMRVMQVMPVIFTGFFAFFPAGLVLYWVTNTLLSIAQQWKINRVVAAESKKDRGGKKPKTG